VSACRASRLLSSLTLSLFLTLAWTTHVASAAPPTGNFACSFVLITVNGSGERDGSPTVERIRRTWRAQTPAGSRTLAAVPLAYPAQPWTRYIDLANFARNRRVNWDGLTKSEDIGVRELRSMIKTLRSSCSGRPIAIAGYSQGADVVSRTMMESDFDTVANTVIALLGNPSFRPTGAGERRGGFESTLQGIRPAVGVASYFTSRTGDKSSTLNICLKDDPICNFDVRDIPGLATGRSAHYQYDRPSQADFAAKWLYREMLKPFDLD
jgi:hypothetical protein